jgi:hypothetical protein
MEFSEKPSTMPWHISLNIVLINTGGKMEPVKSMFDLYNRKETGLSRSLAAIIYSDYRVLKKILKNNNFTFNAADKKTLEVYYELTVEKNRFDILCRSENFIIIIETKTGTGTVTENQRGRYLEELKTYDRKYKILIQITQLGNQKIEYDKDIAIINVLWLDILKIIKDYKITINVSEEFENYIIRSHNMKIHDIDIWAVVVKGRELKRLNEDRVYINGIYHQPVFIGLREWDKDLKQVIVKKLYPVKEILPPDSPRLRQYQDLAVNDVWVYILNNPIILKDPIKKKFSQQSAIKINFDEIDQG